MLLLRKPKPGIASIKVLQHANTKAIYVGS